MRRPVIELISQYADQLVKSVAAIGFYDHVLVDIDKQKAKVLPVYNEFEKLVNDQKHLATLSVQEQHALGQNEVNFKRLLRAMDESSSTLMKQKWTNNIRMCLWYLDDMTLLLDDVLSQDLDDAGKIVKAREIVPAKKFAAADYLGRLSVVQIAIDAVRDDALNDEVFPSDYSYLQWQLDANLGKVFQLLQRELEDTEANGLPTLHNFPVPDIVEAEIPPSPEDEKEEIDKTDQGDADQRHGDEPTPEEIKTVLEEPAKAEKK